ncbi:uncharacterized protein (TIGR02677 family) [Scopulibacillus darangshiensis]|uniref:Uncharacterized protein (TIGR02677 family) n=1 Tax=Scopulibacillus darangshiensis TaxID=442528 RepID=A0A4R2P6X6_9BACL|nr:TIGR02677 family protein [Scopulibacillus darangshiensis]TCP29988.1 uncharacterized protein (TIGR02677 family) [Scopulibacillus darangshiensis]
MGSDLNLYKKVQEIAYLNAERTWSYRTILRYFFIQHERMQEFLFPEEILGYLKGIPAFQAYTEDQLHQDLAQLVNWKNLVARQELSSAKSVEEFKKKRFRYQCTPYTIEIERMLEKLEHMGDGFGGSLERTQFDRLYQSLQKAESLVRGQDDITETEEECAQVWEDIFSYFRSITQNTSDYIAYINSEHVEERMKTEAFLVYKDQFTAYLRDFIISLQQTALKIQALLESMTDKQLLMLVTKVVHHRQSIPRLEDAALSDDDLKLEQKEKWESLKKWFLGSDHRNSEFHLLQLRTNETIRRVTRVVQRLGERSHNFRSRKKDYLHLAEWFAGIETVNEAHALSSVAFGVSNTRHLYSDHIPTEDLYTDVWEEEPIEAEIKPRVRHYNEKTRPGAVKENREQKEAMLREYLLEKEQERIAIESHLIDGRIQLQALPVIKPYVRKRLLAWIGKAMARRDGIIKTEFGQQVKIDLIRDRPPIVLRSEDGNLEMPDAVIQFIDDKEKV